jgi:hypothetical protein
MYFIPLRHQKALDIMDNVIKAAQDYAKMVGEAQKLKMRVEPLRPVHLNLSNYKMEYNAGNEKAYTMQQNCGLFIAGIMQYDASLNDIKIRKGQQFIGKWVTRPVYKYQEQAAAYGGNLDMYRFRSGESIGVTLSGPSADPDAWLIGYVVMPETLLDSKIIQ